MNPGLGVAPTSGSGNIPSVPDGSPEDLVPFGVVPSQVVDLARDDDPRILRYLDLRASGERMMVVESDGAPRLHVLASHASDQLVLVERWCLRTTVRGDGAWVGVLEPGRLRIYRPDVEGSRVRAKEVAFAREHEPLIPRLLYDVESERPDFSIRAYLVRLLGASMERAMGEHALTSEDALSFVGRGLFWRFLIDRDLLGGLEPGEVCPGARSWEACLDSKSRALQTFAWLDETFNGGLLPFVRAPASYPARVFESVLGNIAHGATDDGQLRLPTDWTEINFAHVPVGLLSEIYEAFSHARNPERARATSIHYTPRHIADVVVREALASLDHVERPRVLDPAAGAGVFLVTTFRQLAEREWARTDVRPGRRVLRRILNKQLTGFDIDEKALRLAELALYLSALELDPNPRPPAALRFDALRGRVLLTMPAGSLGPVSRSAAGKFDLILGNPPWTAGTRGTSEDERTGDKTTWAQHSRPTVAARLGDQRAALFDFPDNNPDIPFIWRAMEWARPGGRIAFVMHSRWLFGRSPRAVQARNDILRAIHITGILNGSELRQTSVWPNTDAPFCIVFGVNEVPSEESAFTFVSPRLETLPPGRQTRMRIDWSDARPVSVREVVAAPWTLKARFRGNRVAERPLATMLNRGIPLRAYLAELGTALKNGYQIGGPARRDRQTTAEHMWHLPDLKQAPEGELGFVIDAGSLPRFRLATLLHPRSREIYEAPLLLLRKAVPAAALAARTHRADASVAYHESFSGISFAKLGSRGPAIRNYLQLLLQSTLYPFFEILTDPQYGVFVDAVYWESVQELPVVPFDALTSGQRRESEALSAKLSKRITAPAIEAIDRLFFEIYGFSEIDEDAVLDTVATSLPSTDSRSRALKPASDSERSVFLDTLRVSLAQVFEASSQVVSTFERRDLDVTPWKLIEVRVGTAPEVARRDTSLSLPQFLDVADAEGASMVIVHPHPSIALVGILDRYALWTKTRARLLASDLVEGWTDGWHA